MKMESTRFVAKCRKTESQCITCVNFFSHTVVGSMWAGFYLDRDIHTEKNGTHGLKISGFIKDKDVQ